MPPRRGQRKAGVSMKGNGFFSLNVNPKGASVGNLVSNIKNVAKGVSSGAKKMGSALSKMKTPAKKSMKRKKK